MVIGYRFCRKLSVDRMGDRWKILCIAMAISEFSVLIIPKTIKYYSFWIDIVPKTGYTIERREVQFLCI